MEENTAAGYYMTYALFRNSATGFTSAQQLTGFLAALAHICPEEAIRIRGTACGTVRDAEAAHPSPNTDVLQNATNNAPYSQGFSEALRIFHTDGGIETLVN